MNLEAKLAFRYLSGRKSRSALTTLAITFAVLLMFGLNGIMPTVQATFTDSLRAAAGAVDLTIHDSLNQPIDAAVLTKVAQIPGIRAATSAIEKSAPLPVRPGEPATQVLVTGIDPTTVAAVRNLPVLAGRGLTAADEKTAVVPKSVAATQNWRVGSVITLPSAAGTTKVTIVGLVDVPTVPGQLPVYLPLSTAQLMFGMPHRVTVIWAGAAPGSDLAAVETALRTRLGEGFTVGGLSANTSLLASLQASSAAFNIFGLFAFATAGFIIVNSFRTMVAERRKDIGMLRAVGATARMIRRIFLIEALIQGAIGTALGLLGGWGLAAGFLAIMRQMMRSYLHLELSSPVFTPTNWAISLGLGLGVTTLSAWLPARTAGRISPLTALRPSQLLAERPTRGRLFWAGLVGGGLSVLGLVSGSVTVAAYSALLFLISVALVAPAAISPATDALMRLFPAREAGLARSNVQRNPSRSAATVTAVAMGLAAIVAVVTIVQAIFAGFIGYIDRSLGSDYLVMPQSIVLQEGNVAADPNLAATLRRTPGISSVSTLRLALGRVSGRDVQVLGIDRSYASVASFSWTPGSNDSSLDQLGNGRWLIANGIFASQAGLRPGDLVPMSTPAGRKMYVVAGIGNDYLNAKLATVYLSQEQLARDFSVTSDILLLANRKPLADPTPTTNRLREIVAQYPAFRLYQAESFRAEQLGLFDNTMIIFQVLTAALALPSLLALVNTLAMSVLARTREIGMLRAIGATRRQIRRMIVLESLLLSTLGTIFGVVAGLWLGYALVVATSSVGWPLTWQFPIWGVLGAVVAGIGFGVLAGLWPARSAAKLDVVTALARES